MAGILDSLSDGHTTLVKGILTSALVVLALYQAFLASVFYKKVRIPYLTSRPAAMTHRASGGVIVIVAALVGLACASGYEIRDAIEHGGVRVAAHIVLASALLAVLALKVVVVNFGGARFGHLLPYLGITLLILFVGTWSTSTLQLFGGANGR